MFATGFGIAEAAFWPTGVYKRYTEFQPGRLEITTSRDKEFEFRLQAYNGAYTAGVNGKALINGSIAVYDNGAGGILLFRLIDRTIDIEQSELMVPRSALGVNFSGSYLSEQVPYSPPVQTDFFVQRKLLTKEQELLFRYLVGKYYKRFLASGQIYRKQKDFDRYGARVYSFGVMGRYTILESIIIVRDRDNTIWAALVDKGKVFYFTNDKNRTAHKPLPRTINNWRSRFADKPVIYISK